MNELISNVCSGDIKWYALVSDYPGMRQDVFAVLDGHEYEPLYLLTPLESLIESSPVFIELKSPVDGLIAQLPEENTIYFSAPGKVSFEELIGHLRLRLNILFDGMRKGIVHFYHPKVASYFFPRAAEKDTSFWLGPFGSIQFLVQCYGMDAHWMELGDGHCELKNSLWLISLSQDNALSELMDEREIFEWANTHQVKAINWELQKGATRFCEEQGVNEVELRNRLRQTVHQHQVNPRLFNTNNKQFSVLGVQQKIEFIEQYLAREY